MMNPRFLAIVFAFSCTLQVFAQEPDPSPSPPADLSKINDFRPLFD
jgi:hypothetical protein